MAQSATANSNKEETNPNAKYVINNDKDKDKGKNKENDEKKEENNNLQKSSSSYYLYKSTNPEEAKKYAPKKLDNQSAQSIENSVKSSSKGSSWNTGATMEQFDYSEWMKQRIEALLLSITFKNSQISIVEVTKVEGSATILLTRGKYRPGYDISFECKWKGYVDPNYTAADDENDDDEKDKKKEKKASGILKMDEITSEDDPDDWEYEPSIKKFCLFVSLH